MKYQITIETPEHHDEAFTTTREENLLSIVEDLMNHFAFDSKDILRVGNSWTIFAHSTLISIHEV